MLINFTVIISVGNRDIFLSQTTVAITLFCRAFAEMKIIILWRLFFTVRLAQIFRRECERITIVQHVTQNRCMYRRSLMFAGPFCLFVFFFFARTRAFYTRRRRRARTERTAWRFGDKAEPFVARLLLCKRTRSLLFVGLARREKPEEIISRRRVHVCLALLEIATFTERARKYREKYTT